MKKKIELLAGVDLFSTLKDHELEIVAHYSRYYTYKHGEVIFTPGPHAEELFIIKKGEVLITKQGDREKERELARFIAGECFGEMDLLDSAPRSALASAARNCTLLLFPMKGVVFRDILEEHPEIFARILYKLIARIASRIRTANALISEKVPWVHNLRRQLMRDKLTGLFNRTFLEEDFPAMLQDGGRNLSVLMIKPDRFKQINDTFGHETGDRVLQFMADTFVSMLRKDDIAVRVKGDEFALLLPNIVADGARRVAEEIRLKMNELDLRQAINSEWISFPVSIGVASYPAHAKDSAALTDLAAELMHRAKNSGGNAVHFPSQ
jgi:diguanylate cyclase (GGDEF)-like protein